MRACALRAEHMKKNNRLLVSLLLIALLSTVLAFAAKWYYELERQECFEHLTGYTQQIGQEIERETNGDAVFLCEAAERIAQGDLNDTDLLMYTLSLLRSADSFMRVEILFPDDRLLGEDGFVEQTGELSFEALAASGAHISKRMRDNQGAHSWVLRHYAPIEQAGKTRALLCGVVELGTMLNQFSVQGYGEDMQLYVIDGETGDFLMDTWHDELSNMSRLGGRPMKRGYNAEQWIEDFAAQRSGAAAFLSQSAGEYFYTYYTPVGVANWMVMLTVPESVAFEHAQRILGTLFLLAVVIIYIFFLYVLWLVYDQRKQRDAERQRLREVEYMRKVEKELFDAHVQPAHFCGALTQVANYLEADNAFVYMTDEASGMRRHWSNDRELVELNDKMLETRFFGLTQMLRAQGSVVSYDMTALKAMHPALGLHGIDNFGIKSLMLIPAIGPDGKQAGIVGACNLHRHWENAAPLELVSRSFIRAFGHYAAHQALVRTGRVDALTGLLNRNSYHKAVEALKQQQPDTLACVYMDANGLHELNNHLGHSAGDEMLKATADALLSVFPKESIYRIGGDEFVVLIQDWAIEKVHQAGESVRKQMETMQYAASMGVAWQRRPKDARVLVNQAEARMQRDKKRYYAKDGERRHRMLDEKLEEVFAQKQDADAFLRVLEPEFSGVYFVDLRSDMMRSLFIPAYFAQILKEANGLFSKALGLYANRLVKPNYASMIEQVADYEYLRGQLENDTPPELLYERNDGIWLRLRILKFKDYTQEWQQTLWIFAQTDAPKAEA